jgi:hypothetical protein
MGHVVERVFLPVMKLQYPEITDVAMPAEGIFHNLMIVSIRKSYPGHARKIMNAIWSLGQAMFTKVIVVVDHDVNVQDFRARWCGRRCARSTRNATCSSCSGRPIRWITPRAFRISDRKWESTPRASGTAKVSCGPWPDEIKMDDKTRARVDAIWSRLGLSRRHCFLSSTPTRIPAAGRSNRFVIRSPESSIPEPQHCVFARLKWAGLAGWPRLDGRAGHVILRQQRVLFCLTLLLGDSKLARRY